MNSALLLVTGFVFGVGLTIAAIGLMTIAGLIGLYCSGFFDWLSTKYPDGWLTPLLSALAFG